MTRVTTVHVPGVSGRGMRTLSEETIRGVLRACNRERDNVRVTMRREDMQGRSILLPASLSRHAIAAIVAQNVADVFAYGATYITIERTERFTETGV